MSIKRIIILFGLSTLLLVSFFIAHNYFRPSTSPAESLPLFFLFISVVYVIYYAFRNKEEKLTEFIGYSKYIDKILAIIYLGISIFITFSQWLGAELYTSIIGFIALFVYAANELPTSGIKIFKTKIFKMLYLPCLIIMAIGIISGILYNAT